MPTYKITAPDGKVLRINAPEGATQEQVLAYAQANYATQPQETRQQRYDRIHAELELRNGTGSTDPTDGMSAWEKTMAGAGRSVAETWRGLKQVGGAVGDAIPGVDLSDFRRRTQAEIDWNRQLDAPLMNTGWGQFGNVLGTAAQLYTPGAALKSTAAARYLLPTTIRGNALQGAVLGTLQPTATGESRTENMLVGGVLGGGGAAAMRGATAGYRAARNVLAGAGGASSAERAAASQLLREADDPTRLRQAAPSLVPGVRRTLAEESRDEGIARLEQTARSQGWGFNWGAHESANNIARTRALEGIAGTDADMTAAIAARGRATNSLYAQADKAADADASRLLPQIQRLANYYEGNKTIQGALLSVKDMLTRAIPDAERVKTAKAPLEAFLLKGRKSAADFDAAKEALRQIRRGETPNVSFGSATGQDALKAARNAFERETAPHDRVRTLMNVRDSIGYMLDGKFGGESGAALKGSRELLAVRNALDRVIAKASPEADQARTLFRDMSKPINRMEVGRELLRRGTQNLQTDAAGNRLLSPKLSNAVRDLDAIAASATGFRNAKAGDILTSGDIVMLKALQDDFERQVIARTAGTGGNSASAARAGVLSRMGSRAGNAVAAVVPYGQHVKSLLQTLDEKGQQRIAERLAYLVANPAEARRVLAALPPAGQQIVSKALTQIAGMGGAAAGVTAATQDQPLEINVSGGTPGPAPTEEELEALRGRARANAAAAGAY